MFQDLVYALRSMRRYPGFVVVSVLSLALGIGANAAIFSFVDAILLRPMPVERPGEVVRLNTSTASYRFESLSYPEYVHYRDNLGSLAGLAASRDFTAGLSTGPDAVPQLILGQMVSGNFFAVLGVEPRLGRSFRPEEERVPGAHAVAVISDSLWRKRFLADPGTAGRVIRLNGRPFTVIGVAPERFTGTDQFMRPDIYVPMMMCEQVTTSTTGELLENWRNRGLKVLGRLQPGMTAAAAQAEMSAIGRNLEQARPESNRNRKASLLVETEQRFQQKRQDRQISGVLAAIVGMVLLIACVNVANLLLGRAHARSREIAIRMAIGAGRLRLIRQLLTESVLLALLGGVLGVLMAGAGIRYLAGIELPTDLPVFLATQLDARVLLFTLGVTLVTAILFGLAPALQSTRTDLVPALKSSQYASGKFPGRLAPRHLLVVGQTVLSLVLLVSAALFVKSYRNAQAFRPGFRTDSVLLAALDPGLIRYGTNRGQALYEQAVQRVSALPGVHSAALAHYVLLGAENGGRGVVIDGYRMAPERESVFVGVNYISAGFFQTMHINVLRGRGFGAFDTAPSPHVGVVNETMARRYWPRGDAIGKQLRLGRRDGTAVQIIGITQDGRYNDNVIDATEPYLFLPLSQHYQSAMTLHVHTKADPASLAGAVRTEIRSLESNLPVYDVRSMKEVFHGKGLLASRITAQLVGTLGLAGLLLAVTGLYGVIAYAVSQRTREFGIRMAIGAGRGDVLWMVLRQGLGMTAVGVAVGLAGASAFTRVFSSFLLNVSARDTAVFLTVPVLLIAAGLLASYVPARRAASVDPTTALRSD